jgi:hypothetical protein
VKCELFSWFRAEGKYVAEEKNLMTGSESGIALGNDVSLTEQKSRQNTVATEKGTALDWKETT